MSEEVKEKAEQEETAVETEETVESPETEKTEPADPAAEKLKELTKENEKLKADNAALARQLHDALHGSVLKQMEEVKLRQDYEALKAVIDRVPLEVINNYLSMDKEGGDRNDRSL